MSGGNTAREPAFMLLVQGAERMVSDAGNISKLTDRLRTQLLGAVPKPDVGKGPVFPTDGVVGDLASMVQRTTLLVGDAISDIEAILNEFPPNVNKSSAIQERIR